MSSSKDRRELRKSRARLEMGYRGWRDSYRPSGREGYGMENTLMLVICQDPDYSGAKRSGDSASQ
jgi:hypothetical protein